MPTARITKLRLLLLGNLDEHGQPISNYVVSAMTGVYPVALSRYMTGARPISNQKHLLALADYFEVDPNDVQGWVEIGFPDSEVTVS
jgi:hypothetical protein